MSQDEITVTLPILPVLQHTLDGASGRTRFYMRQEREAGQKGGL